MPRDPRYRVGVDTWEVQHIADAIAADPDLSEDIGVLLSMINDSDFDAETMDMISCSRVIGLPKEGGGIRPICVPSVWVKLLGAAIITRNGVKNGRFQFGCGRKGGALDIIHRTRRDYEQGLAVAKIDLENAFNAVSRVVIGHIVDRTSANDTKRYFTTMYGKPNKLIFYDGRTPTVLQQNEGVRQGDALSTHLFALVMDSIAEYAVQKCPALEGALRMYVDDVTIAVPGPIAGTAIAAILESIETWRLRVNLRKSRFISRDPISCQLPPAERDSPFILLGACLINHPQAHAQTYERCQLFFNALEKLQVHPQLTITLLRLSGVHKLKYFIENHSPVIGEPIAQWFDANVRTRVTQAIGFTPSAEMLHDRAGLGMPKYTGNCHLLYEAAVTAMTTRSERGHVPLVTNHLQTVEQAAQITAGWLFYRAQQALSPAQYAAALRIRCRQTGLPFPWRCPCEKEVIKNEDEFVYHLYRCQQISRYTATSRHNLLRDEVAMICRRYGLSTTLEPRFFVYPGNQLKRPDLIVNISKPVVTDFTIVNSDYDVGVTSEIAAKEKNKIHRNVVNQAGFTFVPFAMETHGHFDSSCVDWCNAVASEMHPATRKRFIGDILYASQVALAKGRAMTLLAVNNESLGFEYGNT